MSNPTELPDLDTLEALVREYSHTPMHSAKRSRRTVMAEIHELFARRAQPEGEAPATDGLTDDDKHLVARGMERWRKGITGECRLPPAGWNCTRTPGHDGPCAAQQAVVFANDGREPDWDGYAAEELAQQAAAPEGDANG